MTHKARVLALLADGRPHGHMEGYRLGVMLHSRVADLRRDGHEIVCSRETDGYVYRLVSSPVLEEARAVHAAVGPVSSSVGVSSVDGGTDPGAQLSLQVAA